jgi:poly(3-hydroxybutyrate) depolymerase
LPGLLLLAWGCSPAPLDSGAPTSTPAFGSSGSGSPQGGSGSAPADPSTPVSSGSTQPTAEERSKVVHAFFEKGPGAVRNPGGDVDVIPASVAAGTSGASQARYVLRGDPVPGYPGLYNVTLNNTGSGYQEMFLIQVPDVKPTSPVPLLVVFHKYGVSHADALFNTNFVSEARTRGWYMVAPLSASQQNFASLQGQINTEAVLSYATSTFPIDRTRIYGVGFSMGGGTCTSYAARHLDPGSPMFAAIVNHTGDVSLANTYANESAQIQGVLEGWYGGSPSAEPFNYQRCSTIDLDPTTNTVGVGTDMSRNLAALAVLDWMANSDPESYLLNQTLAFESHIQAQNASNVFTSVAGSVHSWSTLDDTQACDYLAQFSLQLPASGSTLADQDGTYYRFQVQQDAAGAFTPFSWSVDTVQNRLSVWQTANLQRLTVDSAGLGLVFVGKLHLNLETSDGTGDDILFTSVPSAPISVTRDGMPASGTYDPQMHTFLVHETSGGGHQWLLQF